ncbi:hypothetical protein [Collinsella aerofaciens]|uniref:hypothetical protein n=1 Tax=Collinsella aerofaciens TaxID=74426 RepID=UPI00232E538A|nr:hypothetical protein [Collinsella aerofaciens]MDB1856735.1 hypothetical protein [Collinsella aerofaciens]
MLPQNYSFLYSYGYNLETHSEGYKKKKPLKDFIKDFAVSPIGELFSFSLRICFGKSITLVSNKELHSDFSFSMPITSPLKPLLTSNASTISTVLISETLAATTLEINTNEDLSAVIDAIFPAVVLSVLIPDWLDEVEYHDETAQRARIKEIDEEMALLDKEKKEIEGVLSNYQDIKSVLCSKDFELEKMTRHLLAKIVEVDEDFEDCKEEDFRFSYNDTLYFIEIKGSKGGLKRQHISKTYDHVQIKADAMEDEGSTSKLKGVLIFASQIELKPEERDPFPETQITIARKNDIAVLSTETLLRCYEAYIEKRLTSTSFKETLSQTSGLVSLDLFGLDA